MAPVLYTVGAKSNVEEETKLKRLTKRLEDELSQQSEATRKAEAFVLEDEQEVERFHHMLIQTAAVKTKQSQAVAHEYARLDTQDAEWSRSEQELGDSRSLAVALTAELHAIKESLLVKVQEALLVVRGECQGRERARLERRRQERERFQKQCTTALAHAKRLREEACAKEIIRQAQLRCACKSLALARLVRAGQRWQTERTTELYCEKNAREVSDEIQRLKRQRKTMAQEISDRQLSMETSDQQDAGIDATIQRQMKAQRSDHDAEIALLERRIAQAEERLKRQPKPYAVTEVQDPLTEKEKTILAAQALAGIGCKTFAGATKRADIRRQVMAPALEAERAERPGSRQIGACRLHKVPSPTIEGELRALEDQMRCIRNSTWCNEDDDDAALLTAIASLTADARLPEKLRVGSGVRSPAGSAVQAARAARAPDASNGSTTSAVADSQDSDSDETLFVSLFVGETPEEFMAKIG